METKTRIIGGHRYRLFGVLPRPVALSYETLLREKNLPVYLEDLNPEARAYAGIEPMGSMVYFWVPDEVFAEVEALLGGPDAGA